MFVGEKPPRPPHAGLHLVENQQQAVLVADRAQASEEGGRHDPHPALALNRLDHDRGRVRPDRRLHRFEIAEGNLVEALYLGTEPFEIFGLAAGGQGRQRAAVESALERQNPETLGISIDRMALSRHLDRGLVGLRARIGEEDEIRERRVGEPPGEALAFGHLKQVGRMPELAPLVRQCLDEMGMRVPTEFTAMPAPKSR